MTMMTDMVAGMSMAEMTDMPERRGDDMADTMSDDMTGGTADTMPNTMPNTMADTMSDDTTQPIVLGIESTCDETAAGIVQGSTLRANVVASSMDQHARFGGVIPEIASRAHAEAFVPVVRKALADADLDLSQIDAIAVSAGPGLAGCLAVGVSGAKALALAANRPVYGINHVIGHIAVTQLQFGGFPDGTLALIVSGGHTLPLRVHDIARKVEVVGTTLDDAAGECFDKVARLLGFPYPGGPHIDRHARHGDPTALDVPRALTKGNAVRRHPYDFSFSGVKTAVARWIEEQQEEGRPIPVDDVCASLAAPRWRTCSPARLLKACENLGAGTLIVGGGFSANSQLRRALLERGKEHGVEVRMPWRELCTDNGAMAAMLGSNLLEAGCALQPGEFLDRFGDAPRPDLHVLNPATRSQFCQRQPCRRHREISVEKIQILLVAELEACCGNIRRHVPRVPRLRDRERPSVAHGPGELHLLHRNPVPPGNRAQRRAHAHPPRSGSTAGTERRVSDQRDLVLGEPGEQVVVHPARRHVVEVLVRLAFVAIRDGEQVLHVAKVEIRDAPMADESLAPKIVHALRHEGKIGRRAPVQQIQVDLSRARQAQRGLQALFETSGTGV